MVIPAAAILRPELRTPEGDVFAQSIQADELARLQSEMDALRAQVENLRVERDRYAARIGDMVENWVPGPMTPEQLAEAERNPGDIASLLSELEKE